jgi:methyltransferase
MAEALFFYVVVARLCELVLAARNTARLRAAGAVEFGAGHYPAMVAMHAAWLLALAAWLAIDRAHFEPVFAALFALVQPLRFWTIASLGRFWTTRILVLPGARAVASGPYRYLRHPNYAIVVAEIALLPLAFGALELAIAFSALNAMMLAVRIRAENAARGS